MRPIVLLLAVVLLAADKPGEPSAIAGERAAALKQDLPRFTLHLRYHGAQDKPYYNLTLTTAKPREAAPGDSPFNLRARLTDAQAVKLIDHLALDGFLDAAADESRKDVVPPPGPLYSLKVIAADKEWTTYMNFDLQMLHRLDALRTQLDGDPARHFDTLLARLAGHRREWEKQARE
jgi:hypothetical protein